MRSLNKLRDGNHGWVQGRPGEQRCQVAAEIDSAPHA